MKLIAIIILGTLLLLAGGPPPAEKPKDPPKCDPDGRYWVHFDKGEKVYCFDGDGFAATSAPAHVKGYFEPAPSSDAGPVAGSKPSMKTVGPGGSTAFPGVPSLPTGSSGGGGGAGFSLSGGGGSSGGGAKPSALKDLEKMMNQGATGYDDATGGGRGQVKRDGGPLPPDAIRLVAVGMSRTQVQAKLGTPHGRILNSGDDGNYEIWTYLTQDGSSASVRIREGRVISLRLP